MAERITVQQCLTPNRCSDYADLVCVATSAIWNLNSQRIEQAGQSRRNRILDNKHCEGDSRKPRRETAVAAKLLI